MDEEHPIIDPYVVEIHLKRSWGTDVAIAASDRSMVAVEALRSLVTDEIKAAIKNDIVSGEIEKVIVHAPKSDDNSLEALKMAEDMLNTYRDILLSPDLRGTDMAKETWKKLLKLLQDYPTIIVTKSFVLGSGVIASPIMLRQDQWEELNKLYAAGQKIPAIKRLREITGCGLKAAKDAIENPFNELGAYSS